MKKRWFLLEAALAIILLLFSACKPSKEGAGGPVELSGVINIAGSTSLLPLEEAWAKEFMKQHPKVTINYAGGGSTAGIRQCVEGVVEIGASSRDLKLTEPDLIMHTVARDAVAIVVNKDNPINEMTIEQVAKIFSGEIQYWDVLGWKGGGKINVFCREEGSGTRDCFEAMVMGKRRVAEKPGIAIAYKKSNGEIQGAVSDNPSAIGFVSLGYVAGLKALAIKKTLESEAVYPDIENCQKGTYPLIRRLYFVTKKEPDEPARSFLQFCRSKEGQQIVKQLGFVPLF